MNDPGPRHLILVGMMGAGKTVVGETCARRLGRGFVDTDGLVEIEARASIAEIFAAEGERSFRDRERRAVADACSSPEPLVIACGGGAVIDAENRRRLREAGLVVWLSASPEVLAERVGESEERPLLTGTAREETIRRLLAEREGAYGEVSDVVVATAERRVEEVVDEVISLAVPSASRGRES